MPMRTSLPSMLQLAGLTPSAVIRGLGWASKYQVIRFVTISMANMTSQMFQPCSGG